jgi:hypothetical protein
VSKTSRTTELLSITSRLIACLEQEIELIRGLKPREVKQIQVEKAALADTYRAFVMAMKEPTDAESAVSATLKDELVEATERVQAALTDNLRALRAMRDVNERVMRAVVSVLDDERASVTGYDSRGSLRRSRRAAAVEPATLQQRA